MKRLLGLLLLLSGLALGLAWLALDDQPKVEPGTRITREDLIWAKHLFESNVPRDRTADTVQTLQLSEEALNRLLNYAAIVKPVSGVQADLEDDSLSLNVTLKVHANPFGRYLNFTAAFSQQGPYMHLDAMQAGSLPLPSFLGRSVLWLAQVWLKRDADYAAIMQSIARINVKENHLLVDYHWRPRLLTLVERKGAQALVPADEKLRLLDYSDFVWNTVAGYPAKSTQPAVDLIAKVFGYSKKRNGDAAAENRAALTALAAYVSGISLHQLLEGHGRSTRRAPTVLLKLHGRRDAAEHLLIAAAVSANGGSRLANSIGLAKEEDDVVYGSGFSFTDLGYDRSGARLGELATGPHAAELREHLSALSKDTDLSPSFADLPEFMPQPEFERRFDKVGSPAYLRELKEIERRLAAHPLYRQ